MDPCMLKTHSDEDNVFVCVSITFSHSICGVVPADQGSRAGYRAFQVFSQSPSL